MKNRAVFMDRDGTLFRDSDYLSDPDGIHIYKGVLPALKTLKSRGFKLIIGTNQSGIGRGFFPHSTVKKIHDRFLSICRKNSVKIDKIYYCPHHPKENCPCRKPKAFMIKKAERAFNLDLSKSVVVGDKKCDVDWGRGVGAKTVLVMTGHGRKASPATKLRAHHVSKSLAHAAKWILRHDA